MSGGQPLHSNCERQRWAGSGVTPAMEEKDLQLPAPADTLLPVTSQGSSGLVGTSWQEQERKRPQGIPTPSTAARVRPSPEQEPGPVGKGQPSRGRAGARQPRASGEHVPGSAASLCGSWQAAENKLLLVPSGCFSRLGCQLLHARAALAGRGLCIAEGSRRCLPPRPLALRRDTPSQRQRLCQRQDDPARSSGTGHRLGTGSGLAALMRKRHHLPASHGRAFPSSFPPSFAI